MDNLGISKKVKIFHRTRGWAKKKNQASLIEMVKLSIISYHKGHPDVIPMQDSAYLLIEARRV